MNISSRTFLEDEHIDLLIQELNQQGRKIEQIDFLSVDYNRETKKVIVTVE
jgi:hypothetical protein